jgi:hypothetical protein
MRRKVLVVQQQSIARAAWPVLFMIVACATGGRPMSAGSSRAASGSAFEIGPGVVVEGDGTTVFLMRPGGGIEAVDVPTGTVHWSTAAASKPLAIEGGRLLAHNEAARGGVLPLVVLDASKAGDRMASVEIPLPSDVTALIDQHLGISFFIQARAAGGAATISWRYVEQEVSGVAPPPGTPPVRRRVEGTAVVDLADGSFEVLDSERKTPTPAVPPSVQRMIDVGELRRPPWQINSLFVATSLDKPEDGEPRVVLKRWRVDTWRVLPQVTLFEGTPRAKLLSADQRHLVITSMPDRQSSAFERYRWSVFSLANSRSCCGPSTSARVTRSGAVRCATLATGVRIRPANDVCGVLTE